MAKDKEARRAAVREYKAAHRELEDVAAKDRHQKNREETPDFWWANDRATKAAQNPNLPWWRR